MCGSCAQKRDHVRLVFGDHVSSCGASRQVSRSARVRARRGPYCTSGLNRTVSLGDRHIHVRRGPAAPSARGRCRAGRKEGAVCRADRPPADDNIAESSGPVPTNGSSVRTTAGRRGPRRAKRRQSRIATPERRPSPPAVWFRSPAPALRPQSSPPASRRR